MSDMWKCHEVLCMLKPNFVEFTSDLEKLKCMGVVDCTSTSNCMSVEFINKLSDYIQKHIECFIDYDLTPSILTAMEEILISYGIKDKEELKRMQFIMTSWVDSLLRQGGFYDLN